jgi:hypothetical protein
LPSSRRTSDPRRKMFLYLSGQIEGQLREAYDRLFQAGLATQSSIAKKLSVDRSAIHHRLMGHTNMTMETIADMVWALNHAIKVEIFDPHTTQLRSNYFTGTDTQIVQPSSDSTNVAPPKSELPPELRGLLKANIPSAVS